MTRGTEPGDSRTVDAATYWPPEGLAAVRVVAFDLDDTLWSCADVLDRARDALFAFLGDAFPRIPERCSPSAFNERLLALQVRRPDRAFDYTWLRGELLGALALEAGYDPEPVRQGATAVFLRARNDVRFFPGAIDALRALKGRGFVLGSITNGNANPAAMPELGDLLAFSVAATDAGCAKPDARYFALVLRRAQEACSARGLPACAAGEVLVVGDSLECDVRGGRAAGMPCVWINPSPGDDHPAGAEAGVLVLDAVARLPDVLPGCAGAGAAEAEAAKRPPPMAPVEQRPRVPV